jgi:hypothetical protein
MTHKSSGSDANGLQRQGASSRRAVSRRAGACSAPPPRGRGRPRSSLLKLAYLPDTPRRYRATRSAELTAEALSRGDPNQIVRKSPLERGPPSVLSAIASAKAEASAKDGARQGGVCWGILLRLLFSASVYCTILHRHNRWNRGDRAASDPRRRGLGDSKSEPKGSCFIFYLYSGQPPLCSVLVGKG